MAKIEIVRIHTSLLKKFFGLEKIAKGDDPEDMSERQYVWQVIDISSRKVIGYCWTEEEAQQLAQTHEEKNKPSGFKPR